MCGITVVICKNQKQNAVSLLLTSLEQLQNRGYDSFGLSALNNTNEFITHKLAALSMNSATLSMNSDVMSKSSSTLSMNSATLPMPSATVLPEHGVGSANASYGVCAAPLFDTFKKATKDIQTNVVMGHTRWATHGIISTENAHPHISMSKKIALVHNGIIENYKSIKDNLSINHNYIFNSQTDSEVIANLIDYYYIVKRETIEHSIQKAVAELSGTYGLAIQCLDTHNKTYIIRNGSPLLIGENDDYIMATSEVSGFVNQMKHYYTLQKNNLIVLSTEESPRMSDFGTKMTCHNDAIVLTPAPYKHWTIKEIYEQKDTLLRATNNGARMHLNKIKLGGIDLLRQHIDEIENIILIGCGTSLHACQIGAFYLKKYQCGNVNHISVYDAAEFSSCDIPRKGKSLVIMASQSGETMDLHRVLPFVKERGCLTMGIINVVDSLIAREVDCGIYMNAGRENAVASTKSFTSSLMILKLFSIWFFQEYSIHHSLSIPSPSPQPLLLLGGEFSRVCQNIRNVIEQVGTLNDVYKYNYEYPFNEGYPFNECDNALFCHESKIHHSILQRLNKDNLFVLGKGRMECIAKEAALKLKEICYIHAEAYSGSALKHGPFALLTDGFPVILLIDKENKDKMWNAYQEVKSRKAYCLVITELDLPCESENIIKLPENNDLQEILYMVALQHICYSISQLRGINPDTPRNLAKVVTVE
jgi:glucosamine--fructose-6-phosphate aminotransferase (isomerizing)